MFAWSRTCLRSLLRKRNTVYREFVGEMRRGDILRAFQRRRRRVSRIDGRKREKNGSEVVVVGLLGSLTVGQMRVHHTRAVERI